MRPLKSFSHRRRNSQVIPIAVLRILQHQNQINLLKHGLGLVSGTKTSRVHSVARFAPVLSLPSWDLAVGQCRAPVANWHPRSSQVVFFHVLPLCLCTKRHEVRRTSTLDDDLDWTLQTGLRRENMICFNTVPRVFTSRLISRENTIFQSLNKMDK